MKSILSILCLLSVGLISCASCSETTTVPTSTPDASVPTTEPTVPVPDPTAVSFKGMTFTVPPGWTHAPVCEEAGKCLAVMAASPSEDILVLGIVEPFTQSIDAYVLFNVQGIKNSGATITQATRVTVNNQELVFMESHLDDTMVRTWMTVLDNVGYAFSCGGVTSDGVETICDSIISTFVINSNG